MNLDHAMKQAGRPGPEPTMTETEELTPGIYVLTEDVTNPRPDGRKSAWWCRKVFRKGKEFVLRADQDIPGRLEFSPFPSQGHVPQTVNPKKPRPMFATVAAILPHLERRDPATVRELLSVLDERADYVLKLLVDYDVIDLETIRKTLEVARG